MCPPSRSAMIAAFLPGLGLFCSNADKQKFLAGRRRTQKKIRAVIDDPVRARLLKFGVASGSPQRQDARARRFAGANSRRSILDDNALARRYAEELRTFQVWLRVRLAPPPLAVRDPLLWPAQSPTP